METTMKTRIMICASVFAMALAGTAMADDHDHHYYVNPGVNPGFPQPRLEFNGHFHYGEGMHVEHVIYGGLAYRLGIECGDMIIAINGQTIQSDPHYFQLLREAVMYHGGHAELLIRNVRGNPLYVTVHAHLPCGNGPIHYHP